jgi:hypothetical protein
MTNPTGIPFTETKREAKCGRFYESNNGQLVFDLHPDDQDHLIAAATRIGQPLYDCRTYLKDVVPKEWLGKEGTLYLDRATTTDGEVVSVTLSFVPR